MSFPAGVITRNVSFGRGFITSGDMIGATLKVTPVFKGTDYLVWKATGDPWLPFVYTITIPAGTVGLMPLPTTDQDGWVDSAGQDFKNWSYVGVLTYTQGASTTTLTRTFQVTAGSAIDFDTLIAADGVGQPVIAPNKYIQTVNFVGPDADGNVNVTGGGGGTTVPSGGWPESSLASGVRDALTEARSAVQTVNGSAPDQFGNVTVATGGGSGGGLTDGGVALLIASDASETNRALVDQIKEVTGVGGIPPSIAKTLNIGPADGQNHFLLQVSPNGATSVQTVTQTDIVNGYSLDPQFTRVVETDGISRVQLYARMDGVPTSGSSYCRTELREVMPDGTTLVGFDANTGTHWLRGKTRITHLTAVKPETVIAQLHNGTADRIAIRTQVISGVIKLVVRLNGAAQTPRLEETYVLGTEFEWMIRLEDGVCKVYYEDMLVPIFTFAAGSLAPTAGVNTWYFKTGNYTQSNVALGESPTDYDTVQLRSLQHWHTGWPTPDPVASYRVTSSSSGTPAPSGTEFVQASPASTWTIPHSLGRRPSVAVYLGNEEVEADVTATTSSVTITFPSPYSGSAVLS